MKDVHLVDLHQVEVLNQNFLGKKVAGRVQKNSAIRKPGKVHHLCSIDEVLRMKR